MFRRRQAGRLGCRRSRRGGKGLASAAQDRGGDQRRPRESAVAAELRARGILPEFLFASGREDGSAMSLDQQFDLDDEDEEYEHEVRNSHADSWDKVEVIDLGEWRGGRRGL